MHLRKAFAILSCFIPVIPLSCKYGSDVRITGTITHYVQGDTIFVSLTSNWESIRRAPRHFSIDESGRYELAFSVGRKPPPVTFIKNGIVYAKLTLQNFKDHSPVIVDEMRSKVVEIQMTGDDEFQAEIDL